jgi:hypothetical protein
MGRCGCRTSSPGDGWWRGRRGEVGVAQERLGDAVAREDHGTAVREPKPLHLDDTLAGGQLERVALARGRLAHLLRKHPLAGLHARLADHRV